MQILQKQHNYVHHIGMHIRAAVIRIYVLLCIINITWPENKRTVCSSWSTAEVWLTEINHWEYYTNQPPTPMVSQEVGGITPY